MEAVFHVEREALRVSRIHRNVKTLEVPAFTRSGPLAPGPCPVPSSGELSLEPGGSQRLPFFL
jgi:hypothetical protein